MIKTVPDLPVVAPGTYRIDAEASRIGFKTRHMFGLGPVKGTFALTTGEITVADVPERSSVQATASAASFNTRNPLRDVRPRRSDDSRHSSGARRRSTACSLGA
jgi:polyisoprenoid-binding protein YceI